MALQRMQLFASSRPVDVIRYWRDEGYLELNPPYPRGDVWGTKRRRNLIRSILLGIPIPSLIVNDRMKANWDDDFRVIVIDGKQRITTVLKFMDNEFTVPFEWFGDGPGDVHFIELSTVFQRRFRNATLSFSEGALTSIGEEIEVFELVNFGGVAQGERDDE